MPPKKTDHKVSGPLKRGYDPRRKPGPGRPPRAWKAQLARLEPLALETLARVMREGPAVAAVAAARDVLDRLYGKPAQPVEATGDVTLRIIIADGD
jgi:hypothetical protein